jgi:hypothetical protein
MATLRSITLCSITLCSIATAAAEPASPSVTTLEHTRTAYTSHKARPPRGPVRLRSQRLETGLAVSVSDIRFYCKPAPEVSVTTQGDVLTLTVLKPEGAITRCTGAHDFTIEVASVPDTITSVVLISLKGEELARTTPSAP